MNLILKFVLIYIDDPQTLGDLSLTCKYCNKLIKEMLRIFNTLTRRLEHIGLCYGFVPNHQHQHCWMWKYTHLSSYNYTDDLILDSIHSILCLKEKSVRDILEIKLLSN